MLRWLRPRKRFEKPSLKSWWVKLRWAGFGGTWQQKPPLHPPEAVSAGCLGGQLEFPPPAPTPADLGPLAEDDGREPATRASGIAANPPAVFERDRTNNGDRSYPIRRAGARCAARGAAPRADRRRRARPARGASFLHHLPVHRRGREAFAAAAGAISGRDDRDPPASVLGPGGDRGSF